MMISFKKQCIASWYKMVAKMYLLALLYEETHCWEIRKKERKCKINFSEQSHMLLFDDEIEIFIFKIFLLRLYVQHSLKPAAI